MPSFPVVVKIGHAHSGIGKVYRLFLLQYYESMQTVDILFIKTTIFFQYFTIFCLIILCTGEGGQPQ